MIEAGLQFPRTRGKAMVEAFSSLPESLRPTHMSSGEEDVGARIRDWLKVEAAVEIESGGFFLKNDSVMYSIRIAGDLPIVCDCFVDVEAGAAQEFIVHMASAQPTFGFACRKAEREYKNQVVNQLGINKVTSWVGRNTNAYIPGLYWITVISNELAVLHNLDLATLEEVALEHIVPIEGEHVFRFYDSPDDWKSNHGVQTIIENTPGVFNRKQAQSELENAKTFLDLNSRLMRWK